MDDHEFGEYQQRVHILTQQNTLLRESESRWKMDKQNYLDLISEHKQTVDHLQSELTKINGDYEDLEEVTNKIKYENADLKQLNHDLKQDVITKLEEKMNRMEQRLRSECTEHDALKQKYRRFEGDYALLNDAHNKLDDKYQSMETENVDLCQRVEALNDSIHEQKQSALAMESKLKSTNEALDTMEGVLNIYKQKEMEFMKQINDLKANHDLFVNVEKDKLLLQNETQCQQIVTLKQRKQEVLEQSEKDKKAITERMTLKFQKREQALTQSLQELTTKNATLSTERQRFKSRCDVMERETDQIKGEMLTKFDALKTTENELQCRVKQLELEKDRCSEMAQRREHELSQQSKLWKSEREILGQTIAELNRNDDQKNLNLIQDQETILELNEQIDKMSERLKMEQSRNGKMIETLSSKLSQNESAFNSTMEHYKAELAKFESLYSDSQVMTKEIISKHEALSTKWKEENRNSFTNFTKMIGELKKENKSLITANLSLQGKMEHILGNQRNTVSENEKMNKKLINAQKTTHSLTESVENLKRTNANYRKKETLLLTENKNLRNELNKTQISMQRMQRNHQFNAKLNSH